MIPFFIYYILSISKILYKMKIKTTDNSVLIKDGVQTIAGNVGSFGYTYSIPTDSVTITKDGKALMTSALSTSTVNDEALTPTNIDEKMKPIFLTLLGGGGGITEETDPLFTEWVNDSKVVAGSGADAGTSINIAIGRKAKATGQQTVAIGDQAKAEANYATSIGLQAKAASSGTSIGYTTNASSWSTALGAGAEANGSQSTALGAEANTNNTKEIGIGSYNKSVSTGTVANKTHLGIASFNSTSSDKKNVIEARQNDDIYIYKDGAQIKLQDHLGSVNRKVINVTDTKIRLDADADLIYIWDFNSNVPFTSFTMEEDAATARLNTTNSATIVLKFTGSQSSSITVNLPKNLVYSTDADAKYYINTVNGSGSEAGVNSFTLKGNEMKVINIYGIGDKRIMEIDY